jgi:Ca2+-transporting ATPase
MLVYLLATNTGEVLVSIGALLIGMPLPLVAVQLLWINLVTDTTMVIPLGLEQGERDVMKRPPRHPKSPIINRYMVERIVLIAVLVAVLTLAVFWWFNRHYGLEYGRTMAFSVLIVLQWASAFSTRSLVTSLFRHAAHNWKLLGAFAASIVLQIAVLFTPFGERLFHTLAVDWWQLLAVCGACSVGLILAVEIHKMIGRRRRSPLQ